MDIDEDIAPTASIKAAYYHSLARRRPQKVNNLKCVQMYECVVCDKLYKSEKALQNHEASKKHKEQMKKFKRMMKEEDGLCVQDLKL
jgi:hypothetical protein